MKKIIYETKLFLVWYVILIRFQTNRIKSLAWNRGVKLWWYRLWIRKDEFHSSLDMDIDAMIYINEKKRNEYLDDLERRRHIAHIRDLKKKSPTFARW